MKCPKCGAALESPADPTRRVLTCPSCSAEGDIYDQIQFRTVAVAVKERGT